MGRRIEIDKDWLYQKYVEEELSCAKIAELIKVSDHTIYDRLKEYNIPIRQNKKITKEMEEEIIERYLRGIGTVELGKKYNVHYSTIQNILSKNNINFRGVSSYIGTYDINFFDTYTKESCYWAGFIAADGCIRHDKNCLDIKLCLQDKQHLMKLINLMDYKGKIYEGTAGFRNQYEWCRICLFGKHLTDSLKNNFNIYPNKTFTISVPEQMPIKFIPDYLRGYFDGDGCVSFADKRLRISFSSGSKKMLNFIIEYFYNLGIRVKKNIRNLTEKPKIYKNIEISYSGQNAIKILHLLYDNSTEMTRLARKYERFINYIKEDNIG